MQRLQDVGLVVAVDLDGLPAKGLEAVCEHRAIMAIGRRARLGEAVHVDNGNHSCQLVQGSELGGFPYRTFRTLAVAEQAIDIGVDTVEAVGQRDAIGRGQALTEGAGGNPDPRIVGRGMAFEIAVEATQGKNVVGNGAGLV